MSSNSLVKDAVQNAVNRNNITAIKPVEVAAPLTFDEAYFFVLTLEVVDFQKSTLVKKLQGIHKQNFNNLCTHINNWRSAYMKGWSAAEKANFDNMATAAWEVMNEFMKATDKRQLLTVVQCFNEGLVRMEGIDKPMNEVSFEETLESKVKEKKPRAPRKMKVSPQSAAA